ncbi:hypothetical protein BaRGS_00007638 [Batillaria attramentaria]|uniref:Uncharacterized protein n=1 Tax=Batillaria attramentaria TaxID=370345 RepID=A0ABD0LQ60_9CAEN
MRLKAREHIKQHTAAIGRQTASSGEGNTSTNSLPTPGGRWWSGGLTKHPERNNKQGTGGWNHLLGASDHVYLVYVSGGLVTSRSGRGKWRWRVPFKKLIRVHQRITPSPPPCLLRA